MRRIFILVVILLGMNFTDCCFAQLWVARYNGPDSLDDCAYAIAVDDLGNVYVTGSGYSSGTELDYVTIKYNSLGDTLWVRRYNGPDNNYDEAYAIAIDNSGNVYVTGQSWDSGTNDDYATIKYDSSGDTVWVRRYNGPGDSTDVATAIAVDDSGNVYVTGKSIGSGTDEDYATIKYNSAGDTVWVRRYNGPGNFDDEAKAIAVDGSGNVYVTGYSCGECATIKYNPAGDTLWVRRGISFPGCGNCANAIAVDGSENVYVTGFLKCPEGCCRYYLTIKYSPAGDTVWSRVYDGPGSTPIGDWNEATAIAVDDSGNVYVTGKSIGSGTDEDYATIKYNSAGDTVWVRRYNGPGNGYDGVKAIAVDGDYVYVTGKSYDSENQSDYATIKYNFSGETVWVKRYNGHNGPSNRNDEASAIAVNNNYVYVTGGSMGSGTSYDYATIKYSCAGVEEKDKRLEIRDWRLQIYPNPSCGNAVIKYGLPDKLTTRNSQLVTLKVYDLGGRLVKTLVDGEVEAGHHEIKLMGRHDKPCPYKRGIYFVQLKSGEFRATQKFIILK